MPALISFLAGLMFLWGGIFLMRYGLKKLLLHKVKNILYTLTVTPLKELLFGTAAATLMQSSTAVSLLTIGMVSANYLSFEQSLGIILGANIGTCTTVQFLTLPIFNYYFIIGLIIIAFLFSLIKKLRPLATALFGISAMFLGLSLLSGFSWNKDQLSLITNYLSANSDSVITGIVCRIAMTFLFQSSSAATAVIMVLASQEMLDLNTSAYIVYGNNIGSCLPALFVGAASPPAAKKPALAHFLLNILGTLIFLPVTPILTNIAAWLTNNFAGQVAMFHTLFNIISSLAVLPFQQTVR